MVYKDFALLASDTARTKAYLQEMVLCGNLPGLCIVYSNNIKQMIHEAECWHGRANFSDIPYFCLEEPVFWTIRKAGIPYIIVENQDINSAELEACLKSIRAKYIIYSGYGGDLLKKHLFHIGKRFIHIHAGILPEYRGSTTLYYSWLQEGTVGVTAIFLELDIDKGDIIAQEYFSIPNGKLDIDYVYEPYIRSKVLTQVFELYRREGTLQGYRQEETKSETYFIIHPLLKHIALLEMEGKHLSL